MNAIAAVSDSAVDARIAGLAVGLKSEHVSVRNHTVSLIGKWTLTNESAVTALRGHCNVVAARISKNFAEFQAAEKRLGSPPSPTKGQKRYLDAMDKFTKSLDRMTALIAEAKKLGSTIPLLVASLREARDDRAVDGVAVLVPLSSREHLPAVRAALTEWGTVASLDALCGRLTYYDDRIASQKRRITKAQRKRPGSPPKGTRNKSAWRDRQKTMFANTVASLEEQQTRLLEQRGEDFDAVRQFAKHWKLAEPPAKNVTSGFARWQRGAVKDLPTSVND